MNETESALLDACSVHWVEPGATPRETISNLLNAVTSIALDPLVSEDAKALIERGRREALRDVLDAFESHLTLPETYDLKTSAQLLERVKTSR